MGDKWNGDMGDKWNGDMVDARGDLFPCIE